MERWRAYFHLVVLLICFGVSKANAQRATPDYWQCVNKTEGSWSDFGKFAYACDIEPFLSPAYAWTNYSALVFREETDEAVETPRFMTELHAFLREASQYYLTKRKPQVSAAELAAWQEAIYAVAHQETFWTHFRDPVNSKDEELKMIRGDRGHGHGLMQIDDRWHYTHILAGGGADLVDNLAYALDVYFKGWESAAKAKCVSSPTNWRSRTRAAYSIYNGGSGKQCRWTNRRDRWYRNDQNFVGKFDKKAWRPFVTDANKKSPVDVACLFEGKIDCVNLKFQQSRLIGKTLILIDPLNVRAHPAGEVQGTLRPGDRIQILSQTGLFVWLAYLSDGKWKLGAVEAEPQAVPATPWHSGLIARQGQKVRVVHPAGVHLRPGALSEVSLARIPEGSVLRVLQSYFVGRDHAVYYEVEMHGQRGFVFGGQLWPQLTSQSWLEVL